MSSFVFCHHIFLRKKRICRHKNLTKYYLNISFVTLRYQKAYLETQTLVNILVGQRCRLHEVSKKLMLTVKVLCAIKKRQETSSVEDKKISSRPKQTRVSMDQIVDQISYAERHVTFPDTSSLAAKQPRNPAAFRRLFIVLLLSFRRSSLFRAQRGVWWRLARRV